MKNAPYAWIVTIGSLTCIEALASLPAYALHCITNRNGARLCIHSVYIINRSSIREVVSSINGGSPVTFIIDCSRPTWEFGSLYDRACSLYNVNN
jgi:hypothetical protein